MIDKEVFIFPYINTNKIIKMDDFEIHPYSTYNFDPELTIDEKGLLDEYTYSFRKTFFKKGGSPDIADGIGILKYRGTILRTSENSENISDKIKILFLLLKLHISYDFFNPGMNQINIKSFDTFGFNLGNNLTNKFGNMSECESVYTTIPENISGLSNINFYPLKYCINPIPVELKLFNGGDEVFGINPIITDITNLYQGLTKDINYHQKFLNIANVYYGLGYQDSLFFYYSIIPSILEVLLYPIKGNKKKTSVEYGIKLDKLVIQNNDFKKIRCCGADMNLGLIARTLASIYDLRNDFLHEGKRSFDKLVVNFKGLDLRIYDVFQLILKYSILNDFTEKGVIIDDFIFLEFEGSVWTTGTIEIKGKKTVLLMNKELEALIQKAESDKNFGI